MMTNDFGLELRRLRNFRKLTQKQVAAAAGLHFTHISRVECGKAMLSETAIRNRRVG